MGAGAVEEPKVPLGDAEGLSGEARSEERASPFAQPLVLVPLPPEDGIVCEPSPPWPSSC